MSRRRIVIIVLIGLLGGLGLTLVVLSNVRADHGLSLSMVVGAPLLIASAAGCGYAVGRRTRHGLLHLARQLDRRTETGDLEPVGERGSGELARLQEAVDRLLDRAREDMESKTLALREEEVRTRVLQADKQHMEAVLNSISDAVLVTNAFGDVTLANGSAERMLDFHFDRSERRSIDEVVAESQLVDAVGQLRRSERHVPRKVVEFEHGTNGETRTYKATVSAVRSRVGDTEELSGLVAVLHDVTREREMARMKNDFVSKVTHELRTPLASIRAYVEMLVDGEAQDEETQQEFYQIIDSESDRLNRMIENMLNISRIEAGVIKVQKQDMAVTGLIKEVVECLQPQAAEKDQVLRAELSPVFYQVHADRDMLYQAIMNVVSNAIKYTPPGGHVDLSSELQGGMAVVQIRDSGMGIPPEDLPKLFEKFYRVGKNKKAAHGTGLGLALVKEIVETLHHGQVEVESEVGKGTTFHLKLPVAE